MQSRFISNIPRFAVALAVSLMLAFMPFTVNLEKYRISLERNEAHAIAPVFAGAAAFLGEMATAAGFASVGEMVATTVGVTAVSTGMCLATDAGVRYGTEASQNLHNLVNAADYPAWDTLSENEQTSWGSRENYDAAKFNSLMAAYGMSDAYDRYQSAWGQGGAGNFSFSNDETNILETLGGIGQNWMEGAANQLGDIKNLLTNRNVINNYYGVSNYQYVDCTQFASWPSSYPQGVYVNYSQSAVINATDASGTQNTTMQMWADRPIYWIVARFTDYQKVFPMYWGFSDQQFKYGSREVSATNDAIPGNGFYYYESGINDSDRYVNIASSNVQITPGFRSNNYLYVRNFLGQILGVLQPFQAEPNVPDYPREEPDTTINIYFPSEGITDDTTWDDLITQTEQPVTPDLNGIIALLQHIDSDLHDLNIPGEPDLTPLINYLQNIDYHIQGLDFVTSSDLQPYYTLLQHIDSDLHKFVFYQSGELKVHDEGVFTELSDIYALLLEISGKIGNWGDIADAPDIIGDFDFDDIDDKIPNLLDTISELAPFGSVLLLSEMYTILANFAQVEEPVMTFPFDFGGLPGQDTELTIDLSWLDDIKPVINFFCILMLLLAITHATIRIVELEAAS